MPSAWQNSLLRMLDRLNDETGGQATMLAMAAATYAKNSRKIAGTMQAANEIGGLAQGIRQYGAELGEWTVEEGDQMGLSHMLAVLFNRWSAMAGAVVPQHRDDLEQEEDPLAPPFATSNPKGNDAPSGVNLDDTPKFAGDSTVVERGNR